MTAADEPLIDVRISGRRALAVDIIELELTAVRGGELPEFEAGAHIDVHIRAGLVRQYSICNDPAQRSHYRLGILLDPGSRGGSVAIHQEFTPGRQIQISRPRCNFKLVQGTSPVLLLAGGIGITPLMSMAHVLASAHRPFELHYCTRSRDRTAFIEELTTGPLSTACRIHHDDGPQEQLFSLSGVAAAPNSQLYICGPGGFIDYILRSAAELGFDPSQLHIERFKASDTQEGSAFTVVAASSGVELEVPAGKSVAKVLMDAGIELPVSCEQGICGTCLIPVLEGVPDHRDQYQTDEEKAANTHMTPCCSRSLTRRLILAI